MAYKVVTPAVLQPFTTAYAKSWLKIPASVTVEDTIVDNLIKAAADWAEKGTNRALLTQTIEEYYDCWPKCGVFKLSVAPIQSISAVAYLSGGSYVTWNSSNYYTDMVSEPCRVVAKSTASIPAYDTDAPNVIKITYVAGATAASGIPHTIMDAMLQQIAFMYENREDIPLGGGNTNRQRSANALLMANRVL